MSWGARDLTVRFGHHLALDGVSLEVPPGRVTAVVGGDGAGKTTLLRCLVGALAPDTGEVRRPDARRIGYLSSTSGTYPDLTVQENLAFSATTYGLSAAETRDRAAAFLDRTGLTDASDRLAGNLSGGMRQKLGVIRAMLHRPELLVLDEPTTGIDPVSRADLWWLIARAAADDAAVVLATAYLDEAERSSWVLALDAGRPLAEGPPEAIAAAVPGTIATTTERPGGDAGRRSWRRGARWRTWTPMDGVAPQGEAVRSDLHDAVTVAALARELAAATPGGEVA
ncbi:MAG TPA: ABC transporter ATP-binding protein [Actinomycetota bacterium]|nr:ABC transporter ATP-binding protein [Actinomycetota bacterium]